MTDLKWHIQGSSNAQLADGNEQNHNAQGMHLEINLFPQGMRNFRHLFTEIGFIPIIR